MHPSHLRLPEAVFDELEGVLRAAEPEEGGAFLLVGHAERGEGVHLTARGVLRPPRDAWRLQGRAQLAPSTAWMSVAIGEADALGLGLAFVHSHPGPLGFVEFSRADEWMHETLVPVMVSNLDGRAFGSFVYSNGRVQGAAWWRGLRHRVERVTVVGRRIREVGEVGEPPAEPEAAFDRQVRLWGRDGQEALARLKVGVVGAGGTGSPFAEQLVRLGVGEVVIVDHDVLDPSNVSRVYGSRAEQAGQPKATIAAEHLNAVKRPVVVPIVGGVEGPEAIDRLLGCDVLVGCTDNHASRAILNDLAVQYLVPLLDVGCRVKPTPEHGTFIPVEVRLVVPGGPCLWCMGGVLDGWRIREERMPAEERAGLAREGYVAGLSSEPSVIPVTTLTATVGVLRFLGVVLGLVDYPGTRLVGDLRDLDFTFIEDAVVPGCVCRDRLARAGLRPVV